ncbi:MAG TPA: hypothetical protein VKS98_12330 [Chthoniobacterales bacterium]|nr:hypothetical protein [Chthoniobacterales bacterium]
MKPTCQFEQRKFPHTDCFFQASRGGWDGFSGDEWDFGRPNLGREYLVESARERTKEMIVLGILLFAAAWPTVLVILEVFRLHHRH